jgi:methylglyoxal synthase
MHTFQASLISFSMYLGRLLTIVPRMIQHPASKFGSPADRWPVAPQAPKLHVVKDGLNQSTAQPFTPVGFPTPTIALIAHDINKPDIVAFARRHRDILGGHRLIATGTTGQLIHEATGLPIDRKLSGPMGGDAQIATEVIERNVIAVLFLIDPLSSKPHEPDIQSLLRICEVHNIPLATNLATAELIVSAIAQTMVLAA